MFCHGHISFKDFTSCPFYVAYCKLVDGLPVGTDYRDVRKIAEECRKRCNQLKDAGGTP